MSRTHTAELIQVDGVWLPGIRKLNITLEDLDGEGTTRDENGYMHREIVRKKVIHAAVQHRVNETELVTISNAIQDNSAVEMTLFCPARAETGETTITSYFYVNKVITDLVRLEDPSSGTVDDWWDVDYTLVEV